MLLVVLLNNPSIARVFDRYDLLNAATGIYHSIPGAFVLSEFAAVNRSDRARAIAWLSQRRERVCRDAVLLAEGRPVADQGQTVEQLRAIIAQRDQTIDEKTRAIAERDRVIEEKNQAIAQAQAKKVNSPNAASPNVASTSTRVTVIRWIEMRDEGLLGKGAYGEVRKMKWMGEVVAVKLILEASGSHDLVATAQSEADVMAVLHHPCIVSLYGITVDDQCGLVMEYCCGGTLSDYLKSEANAINDAIKIRMSCQITSGIAYLHAHGVVHRDIKSGNVMLDANRRCKLIDFGFAEIKQHLSTIGVSSAKAGASIVGTLPWMAPEIFAHEDHDAGIPYNKSTDMYALGITLWEIVTRKIPFNSLKGNVGLIAVWKTQGKHDPIPADAPAHLADAIERCRKVDAKDRPSAADVLYTLEELESAFK
jgi:hypothetical protein